MAGKEEADTILPFSSKRKGKDKYLNQNKSAGI
jgi:hypothetical protein